jgi:hypothetical protein
VTTSETPSIVGQTVHIVALDTKYGMTVIVCATPEGLEEAFYGWLKENWTLDEPIPAAVDEAAEMYFDDWGGDSYWFETAKVER